MSIADDCNPWQLRAKYITFYYTVKSIEKLSCAMDSGGIEEKRISTMLKKGISCVEGLFDSEFRSCMNDRISKLSDFLTTILTFDLTDLKVL